MNTNIICKWGEKGIMLVDMRKMLDESKNLNGGDENDTTQKPV